MTSHINLILFLTAICLSVTACGNKVDAVRKSAVNSNDDASASDTAGASASGRAVTYTEDIQPILAAECLSCHSQDKQGLDRNGARIGVDFDTYELSKQNAERANSRIQRGTMPPSGGIPEADRLLFQLWLDQGTPQ